MPDKLHYFIFISHNTVNNNINMHAKNKKMTQQTWKTHMLCNSEDKYKHSQLNNSVNIQTKCLPIEIAECEFSETSGGVHQT